MVVVPWQELSPQALTGLLEAIVNREGTDYGEFEVSFEAKVTELREELMAERALVVFDPLSETSTVLSKSQYEEFMRMAQAANQDIE